MINLQRTRLDPYCVVRVWAKLDDALRILAKKLGLFPIVPEVPPQITADVFENSVMTATDF